LENGGWMLAISTFRGRNHFWNMYESFRDNPKAFAENLTIDDTRREDGSLIITPEMLDEERRNGASEAKIRQEYYGNPDGALEGAFYAEQLQAMRETKRIGIFPFDPMRKCASFWDIGRDMTSIGVFQSNPFTKRPIMVDYFAEKKKGLPHFEKLLRESQYSFAAHVPPHDMGRVDWSVDKSRMNIASDLGINFEPPLPKLPIEDGIEAAQIFLGTLCVNINERTQEAISGWQAYRTEENDSKFKVTADRVGPKWASHPSDMLRYAATGWSGVVDLLDSGDFEHKFKTIRALQ